MPDWPLISELGPVGALPTAPRVARGFAGVVLSGWRLAGLIDITELLVSELATNVVEAATGPGGSPWYDAEGRLPVLWVRLLCDRSRLLIEVWDNLPEFLGAPTVRHAGWDDESGRGLAMIQEIAEDWGWEVAPDWKGKRVWAILPAKSS